MVFGFVLLLFGWLVGVFFFFLDTFKIPRRKKNLVSPGIGENKTMVAEWKRKMCLWMKLRRGCKENERMIRRKWFDHFYRKSLEKMGMNNIKCYREIGKEQDRNPDSKESRIRMWVFWLQITLEGWLKSVRKNVEVEGGARWIEGSSLPPSCFSFPPSFPSFLFFFPSF